MSCFCGTGPALSGEITSQSDKPKEWLVAAVKNWMADIPDSTLLNKISIPGTHDTGALHGSIITQTQSWSIGEQLTAGIRFFDIRNRPAGKSFAIHHGIVFQWLFFGDVLDECRAFLNKCPGETVIMRVKEEFIPRIGSESFQEIWSRYMEDYADLFVPDLRDKIPALGDVRGKIVVLRNAEFSGFGLKYDGVNTDIQDFYKVYSTRTDFPKGQDTVSVAQKKKFIEQYLRKASLSSKIVLNYVSGSTGMHPINVAKVTNKSVHNNVGIHHGPQLTGVLIMDFPGEKLIHRVIRTNFSSV